MLALLVLLGCGGDAMTTSRGSDGGASDAGRRDAGTLLRLDAGAEIDAALADSGSSVDAGEVLPDPRACAWRSTTFDAPLVELDTASGSSAPLRFEIPGVPDPALVVSAVLRFTSYDADHPGEEGVITVNGSPFDLPAMATWDNVEGSGEVDVGAALVAGLNVVAFGPGPLERSFFRIGAVQLVGEARVESCDAAPEPPPPDAREHTLHFSEASYTRRETWVIPCPPGHPRHQPLRNYAFTASGDEHEATDCDGAYVPGGDRRGTATFRFEGVVRGRYRITIRSRHTENRNPGGALFVVAGEERRIDQTTSSDYEDDVFGERTLEGTVDVVLDSSREGNSDAVTSVTLTPVPG